MRDFIIFALLICCGMRISECLTIKLEHINLNERWLTTGYMKGARKTVLRTKKALLFFYPHALVPYLERFLYHIRENSRGWLFPGRNSHESISGKYTYVRNNYEAKFTNFHKFRRT